MWRSLEDYTGSLNACSISSCGTMGAFGGNMNDIVVIDLGTEIQFVGNEEDKRLQAVQEIYSRSLTLL